MMKVQAPKGGRIINIGSVSAKTPRPDSLPYTTTKFALQGMTHQLTMDGRKYDIVASIIHPGATLSSFTTRRGRTQAGAGERPEDYVMVAEEIAKVAVLMAALPPEVNLYEATILPNHARSLLCLISLSSSSFCCAIRSAFRASSSAPEKAAACSINCRMLSRAMAMRSSSSASESELLLLMMFSKDRCVGRPECRRRYI